MIQVEPHDLSRGIFTPNGGARTLHNFSDGARNPPKLTLLRQPACRTGTLADKNDGGINPPHCIHSRANPLLPAGVGFCV